MRLSRPYTVPPKYLLPFLCLTFFLIQLGTSLSGLPTIKLMQDIICKNERYIIIADQLLPEHECRHASVQRELNFVATGTTVAHTIGGAIVALPCGILADRIGRVPILTLSILGVFLAHVEIIIVLWQSDIIPLRAIWASGAFHLIGGGKAVSEAMILTMVADIVPEAKRSVCFLCVVASIIAAHILGPVISGRLLTRSIWVPLLLSLSLIFFGMLIIALFARETLPPGSGTVPQSRKARIQGMKKTLKTTFSRPSIQLLPAAVFIIPLAASQSDVLVRLMPVQFSWTLSTSALLLSLTGLVVLLTLLVILPLSSRFLHRFRHRLGHTSPDLILLRASATLFLFGSFALTMVSHPAFIIAGLVITSLAAGTPTLARSLLVSVVSMRRHEDETRSAEEITENTSNIDRENSTSGSLFGVIALGEVSAMLICQLASGALFDVGLMTWIGLPLLLAMTIALGVTTSVWMVVIPVHPSSVGRDEMAEMGGAVSSTPGSEPAPEKGSLTVAVYA